MKTTGQKIVYVCQNCGSKSPKWEGRCSRCQEWNSLIEEIEEKSSSNKKTLFHTSSTLCSLEENKKTPAYERKKTKIKELDRVLGGGFVAGSFLLLGGAPGIGKSTLVLQMSKGLASSSEKILYGCSEESTEQVLLRANRLKALDPNIFLFNESSLEKILKKAEELKPKVLIIDSIQSIYFSDLNSSAGSLSQVRECASLLMSFAKSTSTIVLIIGHVIKDGSLAGPRTLEHMVDVVLSFEGESQCRILRAVKNRFGAVSEIGVFQMSKEGLKEVSNPSEFFLNERGENRVGSAAACVMEGGRPFLCEVQALTLNSFLAMPRRTSIGIDIHRLHLILAVLEKNFQIRFSKYDIFLNLVGGLKTTETASDLAVAAALLSSHHKKPISMKACFFGEIGLTGEARSCPFALERLQEAKKIGFEIMHLPKGNVEALKKGGFSLTEKNSKEKIQIKPFKNIQELDAIFTPNLWKS